MGNTSGFSIHLLLDGCAGCFYLSATMNNAAGNTGVHSIQIPLFVLGEYRSGIFVAVTVIRSFSFQEKWHRKLYLVWVCWRWINSVFIYLKMCLFAFTLKDIFPEYRTPGLQLFFVQHLKDAIGLCSGFHHFCCSVGHLCDCYAFESNVSVFSLGIFKVCLGVVFFVFILLRFCSISWICALMSFIGFGKFSASISSDIVLSIFPSLSVMLSQRHLLT